MGRTTNAIGSILLLLIAFVAINMIASSALRGARIDATQGSLYTLTAGSRNIARSPDEPITLNFYYSAKLAAGNSQLQSYAQRVREMLDEYARISAGKIKLTVIDPEPFTESEDQASTSGISPIPLNASGENLYFGLVGTNSADGKEVIPFFDPREEKLLEYNVSKLIYSLANPKKKVVGLIAGISIEGGFSMDPATRQPKQTKPWRIAADLKQTFEVKNLGKDVKEISKDIDILVVIHPKALSDQSLYAIDQYVLRSGKAIFFVDPNCDNDPEGAGNPMMGGGGSKVSDLNKILNAWGVEVPAGKFAADIGTALTVPSGQRGETTEAVQYLGMKEVNLSSEDPITSGIGRFNFGTAGFIRAYTPAPTKGPDGKDVPAPAIANKVTITPLAQTSASGAIMDAGMLQFPDPSMLRKQYKPGTEKLTLAARLTGKVSSAFPAGRPAAEGEKPEDAAKLGKDHLAESKDAINVVLFADVDCLANMFWVRESELMPGMPIVQKFADNGDVFLNAVDNMCGSKDLLGVRARQESARSFTVVDDMQKRANERYRTEQEVLETKLQQTQQQINDLQGDKQGQNAFVLSPEQRKKIDEFQKEAVNTRKQLRQVKSSLRKDIESLGAQLKFINIGLIPVLVTLGALGLGFIRMNRRRVKSAD
jgi:ABC-type uncharacterized transport system involved in gliding motility auxiliary subunit